MEPKDCIVNIKLDCSPELIRSVHRPQRPLCCPFAVCVDGVYFPIQSWDDFVVPILTEWIHQLRSFVAGVTTSTILRFMDGPYFIKLEKQDGRTLLATSKGTGEGKVISVCSVDAANFLQGVIDAARTLDTAVKQANIDEMDISELRAEIGDNHSWYDI